MYDVIIGIETHIQLKTLSKMFCACSANFFDQEPNTNVCPVCLGLPGALPVINKKALDQAILVGIALNSVIADSAHFDRKNYFYPDLAKGYQISQYDQPLCIGGWIEIDDRRIGITRAHLEEDVGKSAHASNESLIDFNKGGVPLLEIVSEPVIRSASEAKAYVQALRQLARYIDVNDGNLEQGTMRADINISLQEPGKWSYVDGVFTTRDGYDMHKRVEVKNVNSFRAIERAVEYEIKRQSELLSTGKEVAQETRGWDEAKGITTAQRSKEEAHDYRYFPEPDLPPLHISREWVGQLESELPELATAKRLRFADQYGLSEYDARLLTEDRLMADWYERAVGVAGENAAAKTVANWLLGEVGRLQNDHQMPVVDSKLTPESLIEVVQLVESETISMTSAKQVVAETFVNGTNPTEYVKQANLGQVSSSDDLEPVARQVIADNTDAVANYRSGKESSIMFLVGQVMKQTQGRAKPDLVKSLLQKMLSE